MLLSLFLLLSEMCAYFFSCLISWLECPEKFWITAVTENRNTDYCIFLILAYSRKSLSCLHKWKEFSFNSIRITFCCCTGIQFRASTCEASTPPLELYPQSFRFQFGFQKGFCTNFELTSNHDPPTSVSFLFLSFSFLFDLSALIHWDLIF
jgi:hypothetical protein